MAYTYQGKPIDSEIKTKIGKLNVTLVPEGDFFRKVRKEDTPEVIAANKKVSDDIAKERAAIKVTDFEIISTAMIDEAAIRKKVTEELGVKNAIQTTVLLNWGGFTGKGEGTLIFKGKWYNKDGTPVADAEKAEVNLYDKLKAIIVTGKVDMKPTDVTTSRIVRSFRVTSAAWFKDYKGPGPFGLDPTNDFHWYYGGIYSCPNTFQQLMHFFGFAFALKNKPVAKSLQLDFPAGYVRRATPSLQLIAQFITLADYIREGSADLEDLNKYLKAFGEISDGAAIVKKLKDETTIAYLMGMGKKFSAMLPKKIRAKFDPTNLSTQFKTSSFNKDGVKEAKAEKKKAEEEVKKEKKTKKKTKKTKKEKKEGGEKESKKEEEEESSEEESSEEESESESE